MALHDESPPVLVGTSNEGKLAEICRYASKLGFRAVGPTDPVVSSHGPVPVVSETASSYVGNAEHKARVYCEWGKRPCISDDTGIEIESLGGLPGVYTSPWGLSRVLAALNGAVSSVHARFVCCMTYAEPKGRVVSVQKSLPGELRGLDSACSEGAGPLPFAHFFYPVGFTQPLSTLIASGFMGSHRYLALEGLIRSIQ